jgi:hypothetical protein
MLTPVQNRSSKDAEIRPSQQVWCLWSAYHRTGRQAHLRLANTGRFGRLQQFLAVHANDVMDWQNVRPE